MNPTPNSGPALVRAMTRWDLAGLAINGIIGSGIFALPAAAAAMLGNWSLVAFVICAAIVYVFVLSFAEVASHFTDSGGPYLYARTVFGPLAGFEVGWSVWLARVSSFAANANVMVSYLGYFLPDLSSGVGRAAVLIAVPAVLTAINIRGVGMGARFGDAFAVMKLVLLLSFGVVGLFFVDWSRFGSFAMPEGATYGSAMLLLIYAFTGFEYAVIPAAESRNPKKDIAWALVMALGAATVVYLLVQLVALGTVGDLARSERPLADASRNFLGPVAGAVMALAAALSITGNLSALILVTPRLTFAFAERGDFPAAFGKLSPRFHTPHVSILFFAVTGVLLALTGTFVWLATVSVIARLVSYIATFAAGPLMRRRSEPEFRLPFGWVIHGLGVALCIWLFLQTTARDLLAFGIAAAAGLVLYVAGRRR